MLTRLTVLVVAAACLAQASPALAQSAPPKLKAGLWEQTTVVPGLPAPYNQTRSTFCVNDAVQQRWSALGQSGAAAAGCSPSQVRPIAGGWSFSQTCTPQGRRVVTSGTARGDFNIAYTVEAKSTGVAGAPAGFTARNRYLGACGALKPGQMSVMGMTVDMTTGRPG